MELLAAEAGRCVDGDQLFPRSGDVARFFIELAFRTVARLLGGIELPCGEFVHMMLDGVSELPDKEHASVAEDRNDDRAAGMFGDFADAAVAGRVLNLIDDKTENLAGVPAFTLEDLKLGHTG